MHITRILIPVDFSPPSTLAVNYGVALARKLRAAISLLHVVETPGALLYTFPSEAKKIEAQRKEQAEKMLPAFVSPEDQDDLDVHFIVRAGEIEEVVESVLAEEHADAVAMGTHGRGLFGRLFIGSTTQALLRKLGVPVLTVCHVTRPLEFRRILFATDLHTDSDRGFEFALDMAQTTGASLLVAHTRNDPPVFTYETPEIAMMVDEARKQSLEMVQNKFREFRAQGKRAKVTTECLLGTGEASGKIISAADENEVDFIILGLRKLGLLDRALGSTAEPVVRGAHVPVLSVPIDTKTQSEQLINQAAVVRS
jgi:nucleotide-binding universal stress UspA family protein